MHRLRLGRAWWRHWGPPAGLPRTAMLVCTVIGLLAAVSFFGRGGIASLRPSADWLAAFGDNGPYVSNDSWLPMRMAIEARATDPTASIYDVTKHGAIKFQYPPSSLLLHAAARSAGTPFHDDTLHRLTWFPVALTLGIAAWLWFAMADGRHGRVQPFTRLDRGWLALATVLLGICYYPLMKGYALGQAQPWLNALFGLALVAWMKGSRGASGGLVGLICLVKPPFALFVVWAWLRREHDFARGWAWVFCAGTAAALALFGLAEHREYMQLLQGIARTGEAFHANQSVNGIVNRLLGIGDAKSFSHSQFPAYHPLVHAATFGSSAVLIGFVLWWRRRAAPQLLDFCLAALCFTMASPIAWEHHYGLLLPISVVLLLRLTGTEVEHKRSALIAGWFVCWFASAVFLEPLSARLGPLAPLFQSNLFFAAIGFLGLLVWQLRLDQRGAASPGKGRAAESASEFGACSSHSPSDPPTSSPLPSAATAPMRRS